jgi:hypothetical protein
LKAILAVLLVCLTLLTGSLVKDMQENLTELSAENERLRLFNAREVRRYKKPAAAPRSVYTAEHVFGTPAQVIAAIWKQENGPPDLETGVLGKTAFISQNAPIEDWASMEAARTMNVYAWGWMMNTKEGQHAYKQVLKYMAKKYTGDTLPDVWAKNVYQFTQEAK